MYNHHPPENMDDHKFRRLEPRALEVCSTEESQKVGAAQKVESRGGALGSNRKRVTSTLLSEEEQRPASSSN